MKKHLRHPHTRFKNTLIEGLYQSQLSGLQFRVIMYILRQTYSWHRPLGKINWTVAAVSMATHRRSILRARDYLLKNNVIVYMESMWGIRKTPADWNGVWPNGHVTKRRQKVSPYSDDGVTKWRHPTPYNKESSKERKKGAHERFNNGIGKCSICALHKLLVENYSYCSTCAKCARCESNEGPFRQHDRADGTISLLCSKCIGVRESKPAGGLKKLKGGIHGKV